MASSSAVSQDDLVDNDFEKSNRRSRIRTARARQISSGGANVIKERIDSSSSAHPAVLGGTAASAEIHVHLEADEGPSGANAQDGAVDPTGASAADAQLSGAASTTSEGVSAAASAAGCGNVAASGDVSPKSRVVKLESSAVGASGGGGGGAGGGGGGGGGASSKSRSMMSKMHQKGKGARDRRKLREKRRSTGVVHLASTESTGGSTTGDDEESSDAIGGVCAETKRNTQHNEALISNSYKRARDKLALSDDDDDSGAAGGDEAAVRSSDGAESHGGVGLPSSSLVAPSAHLRAGSGAAATGCSAGMKPPPSRAKSPSDLEADDENDHDSLNQSGASAAGSNNHIPGLLLSASTASGGDASAAAVPGSVAGSVVSSSSSSHLPTSCSSQQSGGGGTNSSSTPVVRPTTPTGSSDPALLSAQVERALDENRRLHSLVEEKDRKIGLLETQIQQLMRDTSAIGEEQARLRRENSTLLKALASITKQQGGGEATK